MQLLVGEVLVYGLLSVQGQASDIAIQAEEILKLKRTLNELLSMHTGQPLPTVGKMTVCLLYHCKTLPPLVEGHTSLFSPPTSLLRASY